MGCNSNKSLSLLSRGLNSAATPFYGPNLIVDGDYAAWTAGNAAILTTDLTDTHSGAQCLRITYNGTNNPYAYQVVLTVGKTYRVKGWARGDGAFAPRVDDNVAARWVGTASATWQEFDFVFVAASTVLRLLGLCAAAGHVKFDDVEVRAVIYGYVPGLECESNCEVYDELNYGLQTYYYDNPRMHTNGLHVHPAATNICDESEDFTSWIHTVAGDVITDDVIAGPDGTVCGASFAPDSTNTSHRLYKTMPTTAAYHTFSIYIKAGAKKWAYIVNTVVSNTGSYFDLEIGVVGTVGAAATAAISGPYGDGWYRCSVTFLGTVANHPLAVYVADTNGDITISDGDGSTPHLYLARSQYEVGGVATPNIDTDGSTESSIAPVYDAPGVEDWNLYNLSRPVCRHAYEFSVPVAPSADLPIGCVVEDSTNYIKFFYDYSLSSFCVTVRIGGSSQDEVVLGSLLPGYTYRAQIEVSAGAVGVLRCQIINITKNEPLTGVCEVLRPAWPSNGLDVAHWYLGADETGADQGHLYISEATS